MAGYLIGGNLLTGEITLRRILPGGCSVDLPLNGPETIKADVSLPMTDPLTGVGLDLPNQLLPWRNFIGWVEETKTGPVLMACGPVTGDPFSFPNKSSLNASGLWEYFNRRYVLPVLTSGQKPGDVSTSITSSRRTIAKRLVNQARSWPHGDPPVEYEADVAGSVTVTYPGSDLTSVGEALTSLTEVDGGCDVSFRPRLNAEGTHVIWDLLTGNPQLTQGGADHYWDVSAPGPQAWVESLERTGRDLTTHAWGRGSDGIQARSQIDDLLTAGFPMLETVVDRSSVTTVANLQAFTDEAVIRYSQFTETFKLSVMRDGTPHLGSFWPGEWARIRVGENARVPAGVYRVRIVRVSFNADGDVSLDCAPERVVGGYPVPASDVSWLGSQLRGIGRRIDESRRG